MTQTNDIARLVEQQRAQYPGKRIFTLDWQGQKIWVKQAEFANYNGWHRLSKAVAKLIHNPLFSPTVNLDGVKALQDEAERLKVLKAQGVSVPAVIAEGKTWIAISDVGRSLGELLRSDSLSQEEKKNLVCAASTQLAHLHQQNLWHGRPVLRDMAWNGKQVSFLDFEEDPAQNLTPQQCMMRDALVYVHSLFRDLRSDELICSAITCYREQAPISVWKSAIEETSHMGILYSLLHILYRFAGKDARSAYHALHTFRKEENRNE